MEEKLASIYITSRNNINYKVDFNNENKNYKFCIELLFWT